MGRENQKTKDRRVARRARKQQLGAAAALVAAANAVPDLMNDLTPFRRYERRGVSVRLEHKNVSDMTAAQVESVFALCRDNMQQLYRDCEWGWNDKEKRGEMTESMAKYLLATDQQSGEVVGFCHFRFDMDYDDEVLYCYEIQLKPTYQRCGLGRFMLSILELLAFKKEMLYVRLTVLKHNPTANGFFKSCGYTKCKTCLDDTIYETFCYEILSKKNPKKEDTNPGNLPQSMLLKS